VGSAVVGLEASIATLILTLNFTQWDDIKLADIGAAPTRSNILRLLIGFGQYAADQTASRRNSMHGYRHAS